MKNLISAWFLKDPKIGTHPLNQASDDLNQVSARMISFIAFFHVPLEGRHVEHVYVERDPRPPSPPPPAAHGRLVNVPTICKADSGDYFSHVPSNFILKERFHSGKI